jgi:general secretion pathway protein M
MSANGTLTGLRESFTTFWIERNARERTAIAGGTAILLLGLIYLVLLGPALNGRAQLDKSLPSLRQQAADMQALAQEALALASVSAPPPAPATKESVEALLASKAMKAPVVSVSGDIVRLQLSSVSFAGLIDTLDELQKSAGLAVLEANVVALPAVDTVNATLTLRQKKNEGKSE